jgi:DNA polymerase III epsilon subunit-like protein
MYLFFDTETTGLPRFPNAPVEYLDNWPRIVQISWLIFDEHQKCINEKDYIIKPENFIIPDSASQVHGITTEIALSKGSDLKPILNEFAIDVKNANYIIAHNMEFDEKIVGAEFLRKEISHDLFETTRICTMKSSTDHCKIANMYGGYKWPNLVELHNFLFKTSFENAHNALFDVKACAKCFFELKNIGVISLETK